MGTVFQRWIVVLLLTFLGIGMLSSSPVYASGGSFNVPKVNDHFDKVQPGPEPTKEPSIAQTQPAEKKQGIWDSIGNAFSSAWNGIKNAAASAWNWTKNTAAKAWNWTKDAVVSTWNWTKDTATKAWNWVQSATWRMLVATVVTLMVIFAVYMKWQRSVIALAKSWGQKLADWGRAGLNKAYSWGKSVTGFEIDNSHPYGTRKDLKVSDKELAKASQLVYQNLLYGDDNENKIIGKKIGDGWQLESPKKDLPNGLQAYVFKNVKTKEIIIAFRGTETPKQLKLNELIEGAKDIGIGDAPIAIGNDIVNAQAISAREFVEQVIHNKLYRGYHFVLTGHSLGGYLALDSGARYRIPTVTFDAPGKNLYPNINVSTLVGGLVAGGPGAIGGTVGSYEINMLFSAENRKEALNQALGNYDDLIRNYRFNNDLVGSLGFHPGETYDINKDGSVKKAAKLDNNIHLSDLNLNIDSSHNLKYFTGYDDEHNKNVDTPVLKKYDENDGNIVKR